MDFLLNGGRGRTRTRPGRPQPGRVDGRGHRQANSNPQRVDGRHGRQNNGKGRTASAPKKYDDDQQIHENRKRFNIDVQRQMLLTCEDIQLFGLSYVGFGNERQSVRNQLNMSRFSSHFGVEPQTVKDLLVDLKDEFTGGLIYREVFMTLNWLKLCKFRMSSLLVVSLVSYMYSTDDSEHVLAGRWKYGEAYIRDAPKSTAKKIQSLKCKIIVFGGFDEEEINWISVDGVNYPTQEFRTTPHAFDTKFYDHKSNGPGLKYEYALALRRVSIRVVFSYIPF